MHGGPLLLDAKSLRAKQRSRQKCRSTNEKNGEFKIKR
jgi:hypothetical protein